MEKPRRPATRAICRFRFAVCHDDDALYLAVEVKDDAVWADSTPSNNIEAPAWDDDSIEIFIDGNHNRAPDARAPDGSETKFGGEFSIVANGAATSRFSGFPNTFGQPNFWQGATNWKQLEAGPTRFNSLRISPDLERDGRRGAAR